MTAIYKSFNILYMQMLYMKILFIYLILPAVLVDLKMTKGNNIILNGKVINPYKTQLNSLHREPPLKGSDIVNAQKNAVQELWIEQKLDNFDENNNATWLMRYLRNDRYFQPQGPIFIFVGGEWEITPSYLLTGHMHDVAKQHKGMLYYVEHRFYGKSWPTSDTGAENLQYLNARQALADLAHFVKHIKNIESMHSQTKVLLTGASYSGSLVAWFAKLYPHLISAGWASSAPLVAKMYFYEYMHQVENVIEERGGHKCAQQLKANLVGIANLLEFSNATELMQRLRVCNNFRATSSLDRAALFNAIGNYFAEYAQSYDDQIVNICEALTANTSDDELTAYVKFLKHIFWPPAVKGGRYDEWCMDLSYEGMKSIFTDEMDQASGTRQWFYQSCHEFGWFAITNATTNNKSRISMKFNSEKEVNQQQTASSSSTAYSSSSTSFHRRRHEQPPSQLYHSFGRQVPLTYFQQLCRDVFFHPSRPTGSTDISTNIQQTNNYFGGLTTAAATQLQKHIIFTYGQLDPWRAVGLQEGKNVISIADYSHTADLDSIDFYDSVEMNVAKLKVAAFLRRALRTTTTTKTPAKT